MPPQPKTMQLPAADKNEILLHELKQIVKQGFEIIDAKVDAVDAKVVRLEANLDLQGGAIDLVKKEVGLLYEWKGDVEQRLKNNSQRAHAESQHDATQDAQLAQEREAREALAKKVDTLSTAVVDVVVPILKRVDGLTKHPLVKVAIVIATAVLGSYAASKGLK